MTTLNAAFARLALIVGVLLLVSRPAAAQVTIDNTTLSANVTASQTFVTVASVTCTGCTINSNTVIQVDGEAMCVNGSYVSGTTLPVTRGCQGTQAVAHNTYNGSVNNIVFIGPLNRFHTAASSGPQAGDPPKGACTRASQAYMPWVNLANGWTWTCDGYNWRGTSGFSLNGGAPSRLVQ